MKTSTNTNFHLQDIRRKTGDSSHAKPSQRQPRAYAQLSHSGYGFQMHATAAPASAPAPSPAPAAPDKLTPQAQQLQALPAAQLQALQSQAQSVRQQKDQLAQSQPTYAQVARDSARAFFKDHYNLDIDPDATFLNTFSPPSKDRAWTAPPGGYSHSPERLKSSQSLTELFIHNVAGDFTQQSQDMPDTYGIYPRRDHNAPYRSNDSLVPIAGFGKQFRQSDTQHDFQLRNDAFWNLNSAAIARLSRQDAQLQVQLQRQLGTGGLTEDDYKDFDIATQVSAAQTKDDIAQGEIDEDQESVDRAIRRQGLTVSPLDIDGYRSHDILRIEDNRTRRNLLYIPNDEQPLRKFPSREAVGDWLHAQGGQPGWAQDFAARHFSQNAAQGREPLTGEMAGRSNGLGVQKYLEQTAANAAESAKYSFLHRSELKHRLDPHELADHADIQGDAFERLTQLRKEGSQADAKMDITTHADVDRGNLFKATDWLPFVGGGLMMGLGKSRQEQEQGGAALTLDLLSAPFDLAPGLAAKRGAMLGAEAAPAAGPQRGVTRFLEEALQAQKTAYQGNGLLGGMNRKQAAQDVDPTDFVPSAAPQRRPPSSTGKGPKPGSGPMEVQVQVHPPPMFHYQYRTDAGTIRRADRRPPQEILARGFEGTVRTDHMLAAFDGKTVFGSRKLEGAEDFATGEHRDGTPTFYIYEIDTNGLRALDISANYARDAEGMKNFVAEQALERAHAKGYTVSEARRTQLPGRVDTMLQAALRAAEVQVEGPIPPARIKLLKVIPGTP